MALDINAQYTKFVQFAQAHISQSNENAIARADAEAGAPLEGRTISAARNDYVKQWFRPGDDKTANDAARDLFLRTISDMFGGSEANIPQTVKDAMKLAYFNHKGHPLTARRIMFVKAAVDRILSEASEFNNAIFNSIAAGNIDELPQDMKNGLASLVDGLRTAFGPNRVPENAKITRVLNQSHVLSSLQALVESANAHGRKLDAAEVVAAFANLAPARLAATAAGSHLIAKVQAFDPDIPFGEIMLATQYDKAHPGFLDAIANCKNPGEIDALFQQHEEAFNGFAEVTARAYAAQKAVEARARERLAAELGLDARFVALHIPMDELREKAKDLTSDIMNGSAPGSREPGFNLESAYDEVLNRFVQERKTAWDAVNALPAQQVPEGVKNRWKAEYLSYRSVPPITPQQLLAVADAVDAGKIMQAFGKGLPTGLAVAMLSNVNESICAAIRQATNDPNFLVGKGADDLMPIYSIIFALVEARNAALPEAVRNAGAGFFTSAISYCEADKGSLGETATLVNALSVRGAMAERVSLTNETAFLALVEGDVDAALDESGVADATVRKDAKDAMLKLARAKLSGTSDLKTLSDFTVSVKGETAELAKALNGINNSRKSAADVAATAIGLAARLGKGYLLNNLNMSAITGRTGKLTLLYNDIRKKAGNGEWAVEGGGRGNAALNKANDIVGKFIREKIAVLKDVDEIGLGPAERAEHKYNALHDVTWREAGLAKVVKNVAWNASLKSAVRSFAHALTGEAAEALDELQMRDVFLTFGKALSIAVKDALKGDDAKWGADANGIRRLVRMALQLVVNEEPAIAKAIAPLVASGRFATVVEALRSGYAAKPDETFFFATLVAGNLAEEFPADEKFNAEKCIAAKTMGREIVARYANDIAQETVPILAKLVGALDWRANKAAASEEIVKKFVEDMKSWRDVAPDSADAKGIQDAFVRRMNGYLTNVMHGTERFNEDNFPGIFQTFLDDLQRGPQYIVNGKKVKHAPLQEMVGQFKTAIKDPEKLKAVTVVINQQSWGDFTTSVSSKLPFDETGGYLNGEDPSVIPGIEKFVSRDLLKVNYMVLGTGTQVYAIDVAPDESTVSVRMKQDYPILADFTLPDKTVGTATVTQEFVIDFTGAEPTIRDLKIGQALS